MKSTIIALALAVGALYAPLTAQKGTTYVGRMLIDDGTHFAAARVLPSGVESYVDYRLGGDPCVSGDVYSTGEMAMFLNRRMPSGLLCSESAAAAGGGEGRAYVLLIDDADVCSLFQTVEWLDGGGCAYTTPAGEPKSVQPGGIFKNKVKSTNVTFYFNESIGGERTTYRLTTDTLAAVVAAGNTRIVTHSGTVTVSVYQPWPEGYVPIKSISLPFRLQFDREALPTR